VDATEAIVRPAAAGDMQAIAEIINHYIETTPANFHTERQPAEEWIAPWRSLSGRFPWLVAVLDGELAGVAFAAPHAAKAAYAWCAEVTVYVAPAARRRGIGAALYARLVAELDAAGVQSLIARIALPNEASVALHESFGFEHVGTLRAAGYKFGRWHDVGIWQRRTALAEPMAPL